MLHTYVRSFLLLQTGTELEQNGRNPFIKVGHKISEKENNSNKKIVI